MGMLIGTEVNEWIEDLNLQVQGFERHGSISRINFSREHLEEEMEVTHGFSGNSEAVGQHTQKKLMRRYGLIIRLIMIEMINLLKQSTRHHMVD
jgi:hypothetical protein